MELMTADRRFLWSQWIDQTTSLYMLLIQSHCTRCGFSLRGELKRIVFSWVQLSTRLVCLAQVLKIYYYVEKLTLQAWHYFIAWRSKLWRSRFYVQNKSGNIQVQHVTLLLKTYGFRGELNRILSGAYQCSRCRAALVPSV